MQSTGDDVRQMCMAGVLSTEDDTAYGHTHGRCAIYWR